MSLTPGQSTGAATPASAAAASASTDTASNSAERASALSRSVSIAVMIARGMVCVSPNRLPANIIVAPNSDSARAHDNPSPGDYGRRGQRQRYPPEGSQRRHSQGLRNFFIVQGHRLKPQFGRPDVEGRGHENLGEHHCRRGEGYVCPHVAQQPAD